MTAIEETEVGRMAELDEDVRRQLLDEIRRRARRERNAAQAAFVCDLHDRARLAHRCARYWDWLEAAVADRYTLSGADAWLVEHLRGPIEKRVLAAAKVKKAKALAGSGASA